MREVRLGDDVDDYCIRCKRIMNHAVVSVVNAEPAKVRCRTCHSDHDYRREQPPPPKVDQRKAALFNEVLKKVDPGAPAAAPDPDEAAPDAVGLEPAETGEAAAEPVPAETAKPKAKAKGRARR
jgi:hypothetical protein